MLSLEAISFFLALVAISQASLLIDIGKTGQVYNAAGTDDGFTAAVFPISTLPFFERNVTSIYMGMNGVITINGTMNQQQSFNLKGWPRLDGSISYLAPLWADTNGFHIGAMRCSESQDPVLLRQARDVVLNANPGLFGFNAEFMFVGNWVDVTPCGCFFPRNTFQVVWVTDGCTAFAIYSYEKVGWGVDENARIGVVNHLDQIHNEHTSSSNRNFAGLTGNNIVMSLGGENICTGRSAGETVIDSDGVPHICGHCKPSDRVPPVNGGYTTWSAWSACSRTCGDGIHTKTRNCSNPIPQHGGLNCLQQGLGPETITESCKDRECPINGGFTQWTAWSACSQTCGNGFHTKRRFCTNPSPQHGGLSCQFQNLGPDTITEACKDRECPINGGYTTWSAWGACSQTCGNGFHTKTRTCTNPPAQFNGLNCFQQNLGPESLTEACKDRECPIDGGYTEWSSWSACSATCGDGTHFKTRTCTNPPPQFNGLSCFQQNLGPEILQEACKDRECPVDGIYTQWSQWGACSVTCGTGTHIRNRQCIGPFHGGRPCTDPLNKNGFGDATESENCFEKACPSCKGQLDVGMIIDSSGSVSMANYMKQKTFVKKLNTYLRANSEPNSYISGVIQFSELAEIVHYLGNSSAMFDSHVDNMGYMGTVTRLDKALKKADNELFRDFNGDRLNVKNLVFIVIDGTPTKDRDWEDPVDITDRFRAAGMDVMVLGIGSEISLFELNELAGNLPNRVLKTPSFDNFDTDSFVTEAGKLICGSNAVSDPDCVGKGDGDYRVDDTCKSYYRCISEQKTLLSCPANQYFNTVTRVCENDVPSNCRHPDCIGKSTAFYTVDDSCSAHYRCENDFRVSSGTCTSGTYFNVASGVCENTPPIGCHHPDCLGKGDGDYRVDDTCKSYYRCTSEEKTLLSCPANQYFNTVTRVCENDVPTNCKHPFCLTNGDGNYFDTDVCSSGFTCAGGFRNNPVTCLSGTYYNTVTGLCESSVPSNCAGVNINGGYTTWTEWVPCSVTCGSSDAVHTRTRTCTNPAPLNNGLNCIQQGLGVETETRPCGRDSCADAFCETNGDGNYFNTNECSGGFTCSGGLRTNLATCSSGTYYNTISGVCESTVPANCVGVHIDGGYTTWTAWSTCSVSCGSSDAVHTRSRSCTNPRPLNNGLNCTQQALGGTVEVQPCGRGRCPDAVCITNGDGNYFNTNECTGGYTCSGNFIINPVTCNLGTYYNTVSGVCETSVPANCVGVHIDGGYTTWTAWSTCSVTCGSSDAMHTRTRSCTNPRPLNNGLNCTQQALGDAVEVQPCGRARCPDAFCLVNDDGNYFNTDECTGGYTCSGHFIINPITCNSGTYYNTVSGVCEVNVPSNCVGVHIDGGYTTWTAWSTCSVTCGSSDAVHTRSRSCTNPAPVNNGLNCTQQALGPAVETQPCGRNQCPDAFCETNGDGNYFNTNECNGGFTCSGGFRTNLVTCSSATHYNTISGVCESSVPANCVGVHIDGGYTTWTAWSTCSVTCGSSDAVHARSRSCTNPRPLNNGLNCTQQGLGGTVEVQPCGRSQCPDTFCETNGDGNYFNTNECSGGFTCSGGFRTNLATCSSGTYYNTISGVCESNVPANCVGVHIDGGYTTWTAWSTCSVTCGSSDAVHTRTRSCTNPRPLNNGLNCTQQALGGTVEIQPCGRNQCPDLFCATNGDGNYFDNDQCFDGFTCSGNLKINVVSCGAGTYYDTGSGACESTVPANCVGVHIDGGYTTWTAWSTCSVTCGSSDAVHTRSRSCTNPTPVNNGLNCTQQALGPEVETQACGRDRCPDAVCVANGDGNYFNTNECTGGYTCNGNFIVDPVTCTAGTYYNTVSGVCESTVPANCVGVHIDGGYTLWSAWTACSVTCGGSDTWQVRSRSCTNPRPLNNGLNCTQQSLGAAVEMQPCGRDQCTDAVCVANGDGNYFNTDECKGGYTCSGNFISRTVTCTAGTYYSTQFGLCLSLVPANCVGVHIDGGYTTWTAWSTCSVTCGSLNAMHTRTRTCTNPLTLNNGLNCTQQGLGPAIETQACGRDRCQDQCTGKANYDRVPHETDCAKYYECQNQLPAAEKTCPNYDLFGGFGNGMFFHPYYKTCVNTTTKACPTYTPTQADYSDACIEIADHLHIPGLQFAKLPDPTDCKKWITCSNQVYTPAGNDACVGVPYNADKQFCDADFNCFFPN